ncbi:papain fold toxin domain-containing protein [Archangium sp.]|uniref:papain fold toxin domain-containing protein n=1 Tax=Archangium sp. TaxID=1872627 RepID=UPI0038D3814E
MLFSLSRWFYARGMPVLRAVVPWLLLVVGLVSGPVQAAPPASVVTWTQSSLLGIAESTRLKVLSYLAQGDIAGALAYYEIQTGHQAPVWLWELQVAYSVTNQAAGQCQQVARTLHTAFTKLNQTPQYIAFRANQKEQYMVFEFANGKHAPVSRTGYHVAVRIGDLIYDAYTGPVGMKLSDYVSRLHARLGVRWEEVPKP